MQRERYSRYSTVGSVGQVQRGVVSIQPTSTRISVAAPVKEDARGTGSNPGGKADEGGAYGCLSVSTEGQKKRKREFARPRKKTKQKPTRFRRGESDKALRTNLHADASKPTDSDT